MERPRLLFVIDAEEEFDWSRPFSRKNTNVSSMAHQGPAQRIFERYGVRPTYALDYPVAVCPDGYLPILELLGSGACEIGAQLHTWVTPPFQEELSEANSFANNLPAELERAKLECLTRAIEDNLGCKPQLYRAGRYGAGEATGRILEHLGYQVDCSVLPGRSMVPKAPDFTGAPICPYWLGPSRSILEIPVTIGNVGVTRDFEFDLHSSLDSGIWRKLKTPAIAARLRIINRVRLSPEGSSFAECKRLTRTLIADGYRVFVVSYHTPSLVPGHTPYVRTRSELDNFLKWLEDYCEFFMAEALGVPSTPADVCQRAWELRRAELTPGEHRAYGRATPEGYANRTLA